MINRRQILKGLLGGASWLLLAMKKQVMTDIEERDGSKIHNPIPITDLPRKVVHFPSLVRNGGEVGHESFITEWHVNGPLVRIKGVKFINTEIHIKKSEMATIMDCEFKNTYQLAPIQIRNSINVI